MQIILSRNMEGINMKKIFRRDEKEWDHTDPKSEPDWDDWDKTSAKETSNGDHNYGD